MSLDTVSNYRDSNVHYQTLINAGNSPQIPIDRLAAQEEVRKALEEGQIDKLIVDIEQEKADNNAFAQQLLLKLTEGLSLIFTWPQYILTKHVRSHIKPKVDKKAEFQRKSDTEKQAQIKKEAEQLRNQSPVKAPVKANVDVEQEKILAGSLEWQKELDRIAEMARVAQGIGKQKLMNAILQILLDALHLAQAKEAAEALLSGTSNRLEAAMANIKKSCKRLSEVLSDWAEPKINAVINAYQLIAEATRRRLAEAAESMNKGIKAVQEVTKKKVVAVIEWMEPPIMQVVDPVREAFRWTLERMDQAQAFIRTHAEILIEKAGVAFAAIGQFVHTTGPRMVVRGAEWVYNLSPSAFNAIAFSFIGTYHALISLAKWLGSKSKQAYYFLKKLAIKAAHIVQRIATYIGQLLLRALLWLKGKILLFIRICYRVSVVVVKWTIMMIRTFPQRVQLLAYRLFHASKYATERLAMQLERNAKR